MDSLKISNQDIEILEEDLSNYDDCLKALEGVDVAYFLVHSMEGSTKKWKEFSEKEKTVAENFMRATTTATLKELSI